MPHTPTSGAPETNPAVPPTETSVVFWPDLREFSFNAPNGQAAYEPIPLLTLPSMSKKAPSSLDRLFEMYTTAGGPGEYDARKLAASLGIKLNLLLTRAHNIARFMPQELFSYGTGAEREDRVLRFGAFSLSTAVQKPTADQLRQSMDRRFVRRRSTPGVGPSVNSYNGEIVAITAAERRRIDAAEVNKIKLTAYDHATILIGDAPYHLDFSCPIDLLAARFMAALSKAPDLAERSGILAKVFDKSTFRDYVWSSMSLQERELFTADTYGSSESIADALNHLYTLLNESSATQPSLIWTTRSKDTFAFPARSAKINVHLHPPEHMHTSAKLLHAKEYAYMGDVRNGGADSPEATRPATAAWARQWAQRTTPPLSKAKALSALDQFMNEQGGGGRPSQSTADPKLWHEQVEPALVRIRRALPKGAYWAAWQRNRLARNDTP